jgi:AcrR family transcriptional regulator
VSARSTNSKKEKQMAVSIATLQIIEKDGLSGVTHSKVARKSGVSRAWIYEYIGKDKNAFIEFAADTIAAHLARITIDLPSDRKVLESQVKEGVQFLFNSVMNDPVFIKIYFRFRGTPNPIGDVIEKYENEWLKMAKVSAVKLIGASPKQAAMIADLVLVMRLGFAHRLATSKNPKVTREQAETIFEYVHGLAATFTS